MKLHKLSYKKISIYIVVLLLSIIGSIYWNRPNKEHLKIEKDEITDEKKIINLENKISNFDDELKKSIQGNLSEISTILLDKLHYLVELLVEKRTIETSMSLGKGLENTESSPDQLAITAYANIQDE